VIARYSDHAANERTFLAWVRTGIATIAFGFVIEKFNLFVTTIAEAASADTIKRLRLDKLSGSLGRYEGLALIVIGMAIIVVSLVRFIRTNRLIDDEKTHSAASIRAEMVLAVVLTLIVATLSCYLALD
jgi:inner membrane protein YidH